MNQRGLSPLLTVLLIAGLLVGGYFLYGQTSDFPKAPKQTVQPSPTTDANSLPTGAAEIANWKTYTDTKYGFELQYPASSTVEVDTVGGVFPHQSIRIQNYTDEEVIENNGKLVPGQYYLEISIYDHQLGHKSTTLCKEETELKEVNLDGIMVYRGAIDPDGGDSSDIRDGICVNKPDMDLYIQANEDYEMVAKKIIDTFKFLPQK